MKIRNMRQQMKIEREILSHVRQALFLAVNAPFTEETADEWLERVCFLTDSFGRHVARTFAIEEEGGYMDFITASPQPTLGGRVEVLWAEHRSLNQELESILREARNTRPANIANLHALKQRLLGYLGRFDEHRRKECELTFEAFLVDIGGEGGGG